MRLEDTEYLARRKRAEAAATDRLNALAKPMGALGELERLAQRLAFTAADVSPLTRPRSLVVFAADHGAVASGVSLWPQAVSRAVAATVLAGKAGCSVLATATGTSVRLVDAGLATEPLPPAATLMTRRVRPGTRDMGMEPAMDVAAFDAALELGRDMARTEIQGGARLLVAGDIGIGNTTAAAAVTALLCQQPVEAVIGPGAGADARVLEAKARVVAAAVARARAMDGRGALAAVSGLEIAAMAGFYLEAAGHAVPIVLDGAIAGAAALIAAAIDPGARHGMIAAHRSPEPAHRAALAQLDLEPFLDWSLRLGEGTGALTLLPQIDMAAALLTDMATLEEALAFAR